MQGNVYYIAVPLCLKKNRQKAFLNEKFIQISVYLHVNVNNMAGILDLLSAGQKPSFRRPTKNIIYSINIRTDNEF